MELGNVPDYVTHVTIPQDRLRKYGLTLGEVARLIAESSEDVPAGAVETQSGEILLRMKERKQWAEEYGRIVILSPDAGSPITLADLAEIEREVLPQLRADFPGITWSFEGSQAEMRESTQALWGGFALAMAVIYALLAVAFGSYLQPLIVMVAIPFGIIGAVIGHILLLIRAFIWRWTTSSTWFGRRDGGGRRSTGSRLDRHLASTRARMFDAIPAGD